ncbi:MAG: hypothetical protein P4L99_02460 [Chthoniobacter sp.]|nr:hypothetical protein [Chthoniobacter sp.]
MNNLPHLLHPEKTPLDEPEPEAILLTWQAHIRLLTNGHVWLNIFAAFGISCVLMTILFLVISKSIMAIAVGSVIFAGFMLLYLLIAIVIDLFGGFRTTFALTSQGVRSIAGKHAQHAADAAFWAGILAGKPGAIGAGLGAKAEQNVFIPYASVTKIKLSAQSRTILVKGGFVDKPIRLYCNAENHAHAEAILQEKCPGGAFT